MRQLAIHAAVGDIFVLLAARLPKGGGVRPRSASNAQRNLKTASAASFEFLGRAQRASIFGGGRSELKGFGGWAEATALSVLCKWVS